jgi:uncharacterized repeat protein (TIGR03803 family)
MITIDYCMKRRSPRGFAGACWLWILVFVAQPAIAQTNFTMLKSLTLPEGAIPFCTLLAGSDGALYGTTAAGGTSNLGAVFKLNKDGSKFATLKSFVGTDGANSIAGLLEGTNGALYGTTKAGGSSNFGTVFKINKDGNGYTVLHSFLNGADGKNPMSALIKGSDNALYGTTDFGSGTTRGTVFTMDHNGNNYTVLHTFTGNPDGQQIQSKLVESTNGSLYGTTFFGGTTVLGVVFKMDKDGNNYAVLHTFQGTGGDGRNPAAGLLEASDGMLYGTAYNGGSANVGAIFTMNHDGSVYSVVRNFLTTGGDGQHPDTDLVEGADGALYGATERGGTAGHGTVFKMNKDGSGYTVLHSFTAAGGDGDTPYAALTDGRDGVFYCSTELGGDIGGGCIFALSSVPLQPRVISLFPSSNSNTVQFAGTSAIQYDVLRSTNLASWSSLTTLTAPLNGRFGYTDLNPPTPAAFYRLQKH